MMKGEKEEENETNNVENNVVAAKEKLYSTIFI
jgi:hypothetical protein